MPESLDDRRIVVLDVESTGPSPSQDHIVEFSAQFGLNDDAEQWTVRMRPGIPITPGAEAVHGISNADVSDLDGFNAHAPRIRSLIEEADVVIGYNVGFDIEMIFSEFTRHDLEAPSLATTRIVDPFLVWRACEPRNLQSAHKRFVGREFDDAHSAAADIAATGRVLEGMIETFELDDKSWDDLAALGVGGPESWIGPSSHIKWRDGRPTLAFGQHRGRTLDEIARDRKGSYLRWIIDRDFPPHVRRIADLALTWNGDALVERLVDLYGAPPERRGEKGGETQVEKADESPTEPVKASPDEKPKSAPSESPSKPPEPPEQMQFL